MRGTVVSELQNAKSGPWSLKIDGLLMQVKIIVMTLGRIWRWSLNIGGSLIQVVYMSGSTVYKIIEYQWF